MSTSKAIPPSILLFPVTSTPLNEPRAKPPAPRVGASLTFYAPTNEVILFGGASHETGCLDETYTLGLDSRVWRKLPTSSSPPARYDHLALIVNRAPTGREVKSSHLLVFGGASDDAPLNDLWFLDLDAKTWVNSTGRMKGCVPSPRTIQSCGYLAGKVGESDRIYLVGGGEGGDRPVDDNVVRVLDIDSLTWTHVKTITTRCPPSLQGHTTTLVNINSIPYLIVFGGSVNSVSSAGLWILNLESNEWTHLEGDGEEEWPASRCGHTMTRVLKDGREVVYVSGGLHRPKDGDAKVMDDVWVLELIAGEVTGNLKVNWTRIDVVEGVVGGGSGGGEGVGAIDAAACAIPLSVSIAKMYVCGEDIIVGDHAASAAEKLLLGAPDGTCEIAGTKKDDALLFFGGMNLRSLSNRVSVLLV